MPFFAIDVPGDTGRWYMKYDGFVVPVAEEARLPIGRLAGSVLTYEMNSGTRFVFAAMPMPSAM